LRTGLDAICLGPFLIAKPEHQSRVAGIVREATAGREILSAAELSSV